MTLKGFEQDKEEKLFLLPCYKDVVYVVYSKLGAVAENFAYHILGMTSADFVLANRKGYDKILKSRGPFVEIPVEPYSPDEHGYPKDGRFIVG